MQATNRVDADNIFREAAPDRTEGTARGLTTSEPWGRADGYTEVSSFVEDLRGECHRQGGEDVTLIGVDEIERRLRAVEIDLRAHLQECVVIRGMVLAEIKSQRAILWSGIGLSITTLIAIVGFLAPKALHL